MSSDERETIVLDNRLAELSRVGRWLSGILERWSVPPKASFAVDLVVNEAVTNVISYGYSDAAAHAITLSLTDSAEAVIVEILDDGQAFNPFDAPPMATGQDLEQASIGGRGIHLIKSYADAHDYSRVANCNRLVLAIRKV